MDYCLYDFCDYECQECEDMLFDLVEERLQTGL